MSGAKLDCAELHARLTDESMRLVERMSGLAADDVRTECVRDGLENALVSGKWREFNIYTIAAGRFPSSEYVPVLCSALRKFDGCVHPGEILDTLLDIKSPECVSTVREVLFWNPEWDEFDDLAFKAYDVLLAIGNEEAWQVIAEGLEDEREYVRELAESFFRRFRD